jgi:hypothetical protein
MVTTSGIGLDQATGAVQQYVPPGVNVVATVALGATGPGITTAGLGLDQASGDVQRYVPPTVTVIS